MKKISILGLCALMGLGAMAQETVLKEAEKAAKGNSLEDVITIITPAMSDPATSKMAQTYMIPGKMAFRLFDNLLGEQAIAGTLSDDKKAQMPILLVNGYDFMFKALPLDTVVEVDKKGNEKVKTKYSKEIVNTLAGHYADLGREGNNAFNGGDYQNAHKLWSYYTSMGKNPVFAKNIDKSILPVDTVLGEISFYQGFASFRLENYADALKEFQQAIKLGYANKDTYDYAIYMAQEAGDETAMVALCLDANQKYGEQSPSYIGQVINTYINNKDFPTAIQYIDEAISQRPGDSQLYVIKGVIYENAEGLGDASEVYKKAVDMDPANAMAQSYYGRVLVDKATQIYDAAPAEGPEFARIFNDEVKPTLNTAVPALEKAYQLNPDDTDALRKLEQAYYLLNDEANLSRIQNLLKY